MHCPTCQGTQIVKNGTIHTGKPKWKCKTCGRQFVANPIQPRISDATKQVIDKLLLERLSLAGIVRVTGVSARWLQYYVNAKYGSVPRSVTVAEQKRALDAGMRRTLVVCGSEASPKMDLAGHQPPHT